MRSLKELARLCRGAAGHLQQQPQALRAFSSEAAQALPDIALANGVPGVAAEETVVIYSPARTAGQQGLGLTVDGGGPAWKLQFPVKTQWVNPLIGWSSTADVMHTVANQMYFASKEEAVAFAERNGWRYEVEEPHARTHVRPKRYIGYGDNYSVKRKGTPVGGLRSEQGKKK